MANYGLLGGLGRGLQQFGDTVNRGVQADIQNERAEKLEKQRQASIEKRWQASEARANRQEQAQQERNAKADSRQATQDSRQLDRDKVSDSQFDRNLQTREAQVIEGNLSGIINAKQKAESDIVKRYQKLAVDSMGQPLQGEAHERMQASMDKELIQLREQYKQMLDTRVESYGEKLRGTGFSYLLDIPQETREPAPAEKVVEVDPREALAQRIITGQVKDLETGQMVEAAGTPSEKSLMDKIVGGTSNKTSDPSFMAGFASGVGGLYKNENRPVNYNDTSVINYAASTTGETIGQGFGLMGDAGQLLYDNAIQPVYDWATLKPSEKKARQ